jgi:hypothetical protein
VIRICRNSRLSFLLRCRRAAPRPVRNRHAGFYIRTGVWANRIVASQGEGRQQAGRHGDFGATSAAFQGTPPRPRSGPFSGEFSSSAMTRCGAGPRVAVCASQSVAGRGRPGRDIAAFRDLAAEDYGTSRPAGQGRTSVWCGNRPVLRALRGDGRQALSGTRIAQLGAYGSRSSRRWLLPQAESCREPCRSDRCQEFKQKGQGEEEKNVECQCPCLS